MSTEINIKKKIGVKEESVSITSDVNSINFIGAGVNASSIGNDVTVSIPGGTGNTTYYLNESVTQTPYKEFSSVSTGIAEQTITTPIAAGVTATIQSFQTPSGVPGTTNIPGGLWSFYLHFSGTPGDTWDIFAEVYVRDLGGIETLLLTTDAIATSTLSGTAAMFLTDGVFPASTVLTTDRIVVKLKVTNTDSTTNSITFHTEGSTNYSVSTTTLNQVIVSGSVTSVTGTAPIASSGGTTPAISISQATGSTDGYLSSADWSTFNGKQEAITLTTTGTSGAATLIGSTLNIPQYASGLVYFTEAQNTSAPNATVYVDSLTAVSATTDADVAIVPKGGGAFLLDIPNGSVSGGNKRGLNAIDLQSSRSGNTQVASGNYAITGGYGNTASGTAATAFGSENIASGLGSSALGGFTNNSNGSYSSVGGGLSNIANNNYATVTGGRSNTAGGVYSTAGGYLNNITGIYAVGLGYNNTVSTEGAVAFGFSNSSTGICAVSLGQGNTASGTDSASLGRANASSGTSSIAIGYASTASGDYSIGMGLYANTFSQIGRFAFSSGRISTGGDIQKSFYILKGRSSSATPKTLTSDNATISAATIVSLQNNNVFRFKGSIVGKQNGSTNVAVWDIDGVIVRGVGVATTTLPIANVNVVTNASGWGTPTLTADTTNGGLTVNAVGAAATNIQWIANIETSEVIY